MNYIKYHLLCKVDDLSNVFIFWVFLGVAETIVGSLLCFGEGGWGGGENIVQCLEYLHVCH